MGSDDTKSPTLEDILNSYRGRDKLIRILGYCSLALSDLTNGKLSRVFKTISTEFGQCRTVLRLLDDYLMFRYTYNYGLGKQEKDLALRFLGVLGNSVDQIFYPVDHIAWASDKQVLMINSNPWRKAGTILWGLSLYIRIARCLRLFVILQKKRLLLQKETGGYFSTESEEVLLQQMHQLVFIFQSCLDLIIAINGMPRGFLWATKLSDFSTGIIGMLSSVISLIIYLRLQK